MHFKLLSMHFLPSFICVCYRYSTLLAIFIYRCTIALSEVNNWGQESAVRRRNSDIKIVLTCEEIKDNDPKKKDAL